MGEFKKTKPALPRPPRSKPSRPPPEYELLSISPRPQNAIFRRKGVRDMELWIGSWFNTVSASVASSTWSNLSVEKHDFQKIQEPNLSPLEHARLAATVLRRLEYVNLGRLDEVVLVEHLRQLFLHMSRVRTIDQQPVKQTDNHRATRTSVKSSGRLNT